MIIHMNEFGTSLCTRASGRAAYDKVMADTESMGQKVVFDFAGVATVTNSFADEVFGRMALGMGIEELRTRSTFRNLSPFTAKVIRQAIDFRDRERELQSV